MTYYEQIKEAAAFLGGRGIAAVDTGIVLGTGLGLFVEHINIIASIDYVDIPHFAQATVEFHKGRLIYGTVGERRVLAMQGRFHYYEGYSAQQITFPIRVLPELGIRELYLSNAAGGINGAYKKGDMVLLDDHINLQPDNPLRGLSDAVYGARFPDMSQPYDMQMGKKLKHAANAHGLVLKEGVYASVTGPNLETRAEYRFLRTIGADMVGMSTVPEVIVAAQCGMRCAAISVITDECNPDSLKPVNIEEIIAVASSADIKLSALFATVIGDPINTI
jgi:purine-nucleoside phosphorylase